MSWMQANPEWKCSCEKASARTRIKYARFTMPHNNPPAISFKESLSGLYSFIVYEDESRASIKTIFDGLLCMDDFLVSGWHLRAVQNEFHYRLLNRNNVFLTFLQDTCAIFSDPVAAISLDLSAVLKQMIECGYINPNDKFQYLWSSDDSIKLPLICHTIGKKKE